MSDRDKIEALNKSFVVNDDEVITQLFDMYYQRANVFAKSILNQQVNSDDIVQEVFVKIWDKGLVFDNMNKFKAYLYNSVRNACLDELKRNKQVILKEDYISEKSFEDEIIAIEVELEILRQIDNLPDTRRKVLELKINGLNLKEIAEELEVSYNTAKEHLRLAKKNIKSSIQFLVISFFKKNQF